MSTDFGDVEVYYLNMKDKQDMDAQTFANTLAGIEKGQKGQATTAETVTIANQQYFKVNSKRKEDIKNVLLPQAGRLYGSCPDNWKNQRCSFSQQHRYEYDNSTVIK